MDFHRLQRQWTLAEIEFNPPPSAATMFYLIFQTGHCFLRRNCKRPAFGLITDLLTDRVRYQRISGVQKCPYSLRVHFWRKCDQLMQQTIWLMIYIYMCADSYSQNSDCQPFTSDAGHNSELQKLLWRNEQFSNRKIMRMMLFQKQAILYFSRGSQNNLYSMHLERKGGYGGRIWNIRRFYKVNTHWCRLMSW